MTSPFSMRVDEAGGTMVLAGDPSDDDLRSIRGPLSRFTERELVIDLTGLTYLPSLMLGVLVGAIRAADRAGGELILVAATGSIAHRVLDVAGLLHQLDPGTATQPGAARPA